MVLYVNPEFIEGAKTLDVGLRRQNLEGLWSWSLWELLGLNMGPEPGKEVTFRKYNAVQKMCLI